MATKQFYLLGNAASTPIDIPQSTDFEELQNIVASYFSVVEPRGKIRLASLLQ